MDPQINTSPGQAQLSSTGGEDTFTEQVAGESNVTPDAFAQNQTATSQHNRRLIYYIVWGGLVILLLLAVASGSFILWRNRQGIANNLGINGLFNPTSINLNNAQDIAVGNGNSLLTVNGNELINGDLTVTGNANVGGTLTATSFVGDGAGLTGINATQDPFTAYTNKNDQLFFGNDQTFRNTANSTTALQVQQASGAQVFAVDTTNNKGKFYNGLEVGNIANLQGSIFNDPFFGIGGNIYKPFAVASQLTNNQAGVTYTGSGTEFLINPQNDPVASGNLFAGSYTGAKIAPGNSHDYITVAGSLSSLAHAGSGTVQQAVGQVNIVGNDGPGTIQIAANGTFSTTLSSTGNIIASTGALALNPSVLDGATGVIGINSGFTAANCQTFINLKIYLGQPPTCSGSQYSPNILQQIGLTVLNQDASATTNANIYSEGKNSSNFFEGAVSIGTCSPFLISLLNGCGAAGFTSATGPKLIVNAPVGGAGTSPANVTVQIYSAAANNKPLMVRGYTAQSANLTEWQDSAGTALSVVTSAGKVGVGTSTVTHELTVTDTTTTDVAKFNGSGATQCTVVTGTGWSCSSDERLKTNVLSIDNGLDAVLALQGVTYNWKADPEAQAKVSGFIAQEVEKVLPNLVTEDSNGYKSLNTSGIIPYLVEAVKTQNGKLDDVNSKLSDQGIKLDNLSEEFKALAEQVKDHEDRLKILETQSAAQAARIDQLEKEVNKIPAPASP